MAYLFDTDALSIAMDQKRMARHPRYGHWLATIPRSQQHTSTQVVGELMYGAHLVRDVARRDVLLARIASTLSRVTVLPTDRAVAERYGELRARLERDGRRVGDGDGDVWIAACAATHGLTVVTANVSHFTRMPGIAVEPVVAEDAAG